MAMASQEVEEVKEIVLQISNSPVPVSVQSDLKEEERRWLVVGICLHSVIAPVLRKYIDPIIGNLYKKVKNTHIIDTQTYPNVLSNYPAPNGYHLNYESVNNNRQHGKNKRLFDYTVKDPVNFSKLFMLPHMAHYTGFNETCDSSALLGLLVNIDHFQQPLKTAADKVRKEIRNVWAHFDFQVWDQNKFLQCFQLMNQLLRNLQLPPQEETEHLDLLTKWQCTGYQLLSGTTVGLELLKDIKSKIASLAKYLLFTAASVHHVQSDLIKAANEIDRIDETLSIMISRMVKLEDEHHQLKDFVDEIDQKQNQLELGVQELKQGQKEVTEDITELYNRLECDRKESSVSSKTLSNRVDKIAERVSELEHYHSFKRPDKTFFYTPDRIHCFIGRKEELAQVGNNLCLEETSSIQVVCGLGGSGKTTFAIEYSWLMQECYPGGLFWVSAESNATFENSIAKLALDAEKVGRNSQETLSLTLKWLSNLSLRWLLVVDNVDQEELSNDMKDLLLGTCKRGSQGHLLVTTRREPTEVEETFKIDPDFCIVLGPMTHTESIDFILKRTGKQLSDEYLETLAEELGGLPLAMEQAAAHIKTLGCSFKDYLERFLKKRLKLSQRPVALTYPTSKERLAVRTTWQINFDYICKESEEEGLGRSAPFVMDIAAYFFADDIPEELLNIGEPRIDSNDLQDALEDRMGVKQVIGILTRFSLFQRCGEKSFQVHRLVQEVIRENIGDPKYKARVIHAAVKMLNAALQNVTSPNKALEAHSEAETLRGELHIWSRLGMTACTLRNHINSFDQKHEFQSEVLWQFESLKVFQTSAVFHSIYQRQAEALTAQAQMLQILSLSSVSIDQEKELTSITIPIHEKERKRLQRCMESTIALGSVEETVTLDLATLREKGNNAFKGGREHDAIQFYTEAIKSSKGNIVDPRLYSNRSLCFYRIQDYERALDDADSCIRLDPSNWKAHCWRAYAVASLIKKGILPKTMEATGLASASVAAYKNPKCKLAFKMKIFYPILLSKVVSDSNSFGQEFETILDQPYTTLLLKKGKFNCEKMFATKSIQVIGIEDGVQLFISQVLQISPVCKKMFTIDFTPEKELQVHFENIHFIEGGQQIIAHGKTTLSFYRCKFSNGAEACDDFPQCKGGPGCKNPVQNGCLLDYNRLEKQRGSGYFSTGISGFAAVSADKAGCVVLERCELKKCGGGGALSVDKESVIKVTHCIVENNRQSGLEAREGGKLIAIDNIIQNNQQHGILNGPRGRAIIQHNYITGNGHEGIYCLELDRNADGILEKLKPEFKSVAVIEDNVISHNGLCGISLDGGTFLVHGNKILDNWCWGVMAKTRVSLELTDNDIYNNKCGGLRIGFNYSAVVYLDGNTIRDHTGPHLYLLDFPVSYKALLNFVKNEGYMRELMMYQGMPDDELTQYTSPPIITNRNVFRRNNLRIQHPSEQLVMVNVCSNCHKKGQRMKACTECRKAFYCSRSGQKCHWKRHKHFCQLFKQQFIVTVDMKETKSQKQPGTIRTFEPSLQGIKEGPKPDRKSNKTFIVKIQSGREYSLYNPQAEITLYDRSVDLDIRLRNPQLYNLIMECGVLCAKSFTTKKIFCWASFENRGQILKVYTDNLPPFQTW